MVNKIVLYSMFYHLSLKWCTGNAPRIKNNVDMVIITPPFFKRRLNNKGPLNKRGFHFYFGVSFTFPLLSFTFLYFSFTFLYFSFLFLCFPLLLLCFPLLFLYFPLLFLSFPLLLLCFAFLSFTFPLFSCSFHSTSGLGVFKRRPNKLKKKTKKKTLQNPRHNFGVLYFGGLVDNYDVNINFLFKFL